MLLRYATAHPYRWYYLVSLSSNGYAKGYSGVARDRFVKKITFQKISKTGIQNIGKTIEIMAEAEQLLAHKNAVSIRLKKIQDEN